MRVFLITFSLLALAVGASPQPARAEAVASAPTGSSARADTEKGWMMRTVVVGPGRFVIVGAPDGRRAAAQSAQGRSEIVAAEEAERLVATYRKTVVPEAVGPTRTISIPFTGVRVTTPRNGEGLSHVTVRAGGRKVNVESLSQDDGPSQLADVVVTGANARDARRFIDKEQTLDSDTKALLRAALGL